MPSSKIKRFFVLCPSFECGFCALSIESSAQIKIQNLANQNEKYENVCILALQPVLSQSGPLQPSCHLFDFFVLLFADSFLEQSRLHSHHQSLSPPSSLPSSDCPNRAPLSRAFHFTTLHHCVCLSSRKIPYFARRPNPQAPQRAVATAYKYVREAFQQVCSQSKLPSTFPIGQSGGRQLLFAPLFHQYAGLSMLLHVTRSLVASHSSAAPNELRWRPDSARQSIRSSSFPPALSFLYSSANLSARPPQSRGVSFCDQSCLKTPAWPGGNQSSVSSLPPESLSIAPPSH